MIPGLYFILFYFIFENVFILFKNTYIIPFIYLFIFNFF